jgi:hypothetical protein
MYLQKAGNKQATVLKVTDEKSRIRSPEPDPLVRGKDPRIRIRISTKMSRIHNTGPLRGSRQQGERILIYRFFTMCTRISASLAGGRGVSEWECYCVSATAKPVSSVQNCAFIN